MTVFVKVEYNAVWQVINKKIIGRNSSWFSVDVRAKEKRKAKNRYGLDYVLVELDSNINMQEMRRGL